MKQVYSLPILVADFIDSLEQVLIKLTLNKIWKISSGLLSFKSYIKVFKNTGTVNLLVNE